MYFRQKCFRLSFSNKGYFEQLWAVMVVGTDNKPGFFFIKSSSLFLDYDMKFFLSPAEFYFVSQILVLFWFFRVVWNPLPSSTTSVSSTCWDPFFGLGLGGFWKICRVNIKLFSSTYSFHHHLDQMEKLFLWKSDSQHYYHPNHHLIILIITTRPPALSLE